MSPVNGLLALIINKHCVDNDIDNVNNTQKQRGN